MKKRIDILCIVLLASLSQALAWKPAPLPMDSTDNAADTLEAAVGLVAVASTGTFAPYYLHTNRYADISSAPFSGNIKAYFGKRATRANRWYDYDFAIEMSGRADMKGVTGYFQQLYAHVRLYVVDLTAGIRPVEYGNQDAELSAGSLLWSRNAHPLPRITIGIDRYTAFPFTYGYLEVKGGLTHAWVIDDAYIKNYYIHHKFAAARLGGCLPVRVNYEFHHVAQWGGVSPTYGDLGNNWKSFGNVFSALSGGKMKNDQLNAQGNHIGMQCLGLEVITSAVKVSAYWQNIIEDGPVRFLGKGLNARDGLWGLSIRQKKWRYLSGLCYEYLNTTDQSGPFHDRDGFVYGGFDDYYRNSVYQNGWSYFGRTIGSPLITSPLYNEDGSKQTNNNRVRAHHIALQGDIYGCKYKVAVTHAKNYVRYNNALSAGTDEIVSRNTAIMLQATKRVDRAWGLEFGLALAADIGNQFGNDFGAMITIRKQWTIHTW